MNSTSWKQQHSIEHRRFGWGVPQIKQVVGGQATALTMGIKISPDFLT